MTQPIELQPNLLLRPLLADLHTAGHAIRIVTLPTGRRLFTDERGTHTVYFPLNSVISTMVTIQDQRRCEVLAIGRDGAIARLDPTVSLPGHEVVVTVGGRTALIPLDDLFQLTAQSKPLLEFFRQYIAFCFSATNQRAACYALHQLDERLAMWLWLTYRRVGAEIPVTHGWLAELLGTTRASVSVALEDLARRKLVELRRSAVMVLDAHSLRASACDCLPALNRFLVEG